MTANLSNFNLLMHPPLAYLYYKRFLIYAANFTMIWRWWRNGGWLVKQHTYFIARLYQFTSLSFISEKYYSQCPSRWSAACLLDWPKQFSFSSSVHFCNLNTTRNSCYAASRHVMDILEIVFREFHFCFDNHFKSEIDYQSQFNTALRNQIYTTWFCRLIS